MGNNNIKFLFFASLFLGLFGSDYLLAIQKLTPIEIDVWSGDMPNGRAPQRIVYDAMIDRKTQQIEGQYVKLGDRTLTYGKQPLSFDPDAQPLETSSIQALVAVDQTIILYARTLRNLQDHLHDPKHRVLLEQLTLSLANLEALRQKKISLHVALKDSVAQGFYDPASNTLVFGTYMDPTRPGKQIYTAHSAAFSSHLAGHVILNLMTDGLYNMHGQSGLIHSAFANWVSMMHHISNTFNLNALAAQAKENLSGASSLLKLAQPFGERVQEPSPDWPTTLVRLPGYSTPHAKSHIPETSNEVQRASRVITDAFLHLGAYVYSDLTKDVIYSRERALDEAMTAVNELFVLGIVRAKHAHHLHISHLAAQMLVCVHENLLSSQYITKKNLTEVFQVRGIPITSQRSEWPQTTFSREEKFVDRTLERLHERDQKKGHQGKSPLMTPDVSPHLRRKSMPASRNGAYMPSTLANATTWDPTTNTWIFAPGEVRGVVHLPLPPSHTSARAVHARPPSAEGTTGAVAEAVSNIHLRAPGPPTSSKARDHSALSGTNQVQDEEDTFEKERAALRKPTMVDGSTSPLLPFAQVHRQTSTSGLIDRRDGMTSPMVPTPSRSVGVACHPIDLGSPHTRAVATSPLPLWHVGLHEDSQCHRVLDTSPASDMTEKERRNLRDRKRRYDAPQTPSVLAYPLLVSSPLHVPLSSHEHYSPLEYRDCSTCHFWQERVRQKARELYEQACREKPQLDFLQIKCTDKEPLGRGRWRHYISELSGSPREEYRHRPTRLY